jgi:uncharacterized cupredoxin-like copper-binding protein
MHSTSLRRWATLFAGAVLLLALAVAAGCGGDGEDRPDVEVIGEDGTGSATGDGTASGTGSDSASGTGSGSSSASGADAAPAPGVVEPKPDDATQLNVSIGDWFITPENPTVAAGKVYFLVSNDAEVEAHEFVVIKSDLAPHELPVTDGKVPEDQVELLGEIEPFAADSDASLVLDLEPGNYVLICNIAEEESGQLESHYGEGMQTSLTVE